VVAFIEGFYCSTEVLFVKLALFNTHFALVKLHNLIHLAIVLISYVYAIADTSIGIQRTAINIGQSLPQNLTAYYHTFAMHSIISLA